MTGRPALPEIKIVLRRHGNRTFRCLADQADIKHFNLTNFRVDKKTGCHLWLGALTDKGYAIVGNRSGNFRVTRLTFLRDKGELNPGEYPDHICRIRACINSAHLERVSNAENTRRGDKTKLTWAKVRAMRAEYAIGKTTFRKLANKNGISSPAVSNIINEKRWVEGT